MKQCNSSWLPGGTAALERNIGSQKYIDDTTLVQVVPKLVVPIERGLKHFTTATTVDGLGARLEALVEGAEDIGMRINCTKTQFLVMSLANGCKTVATLPTPEGPVQLMESLKLVGFMFGEEPSALAHMGMLLEKFRIKIWLL